MSEVARTYFIAMALEQLQGQPDLQRVLGKIKRTLKEKDKVFEAVPARLWHLTLEYLGPLSAAELALAKDSLKNWQPPVSELDLELQGGGAFPDPLSARVLWLGVPRAKPLIDLRHSLREHLVSQGVRRLEDREYVPHLTLFKFRNAQSVTELLGLLGRRRYGMVKTTSITLFASFIAGGLRRYEPVLACPLRKI
ncbi:MAG: RNA 2',3'-cyclic phosphodiesterase [Bdellovibrionales bacterium]